MDGDRRYRVLMADTHYYEIVVSVDRGSATPEGHAKNAAWERFDREQFDVHEAFGNRHTNIVRAEAMD